MGRCNGYAQRSFGAVLLGRVVHPFDSPKLPHSSSHSLSPQHITPEEESPGRWGMLTLLALTLVLSMTTWFSASAVIPQLRQEWDLSANAAAWLTIAVQLGFVGGALVSSFLNLSDIVSPKY